MLKSYLQKEMVKIITSSVNSVDKIISIYEHFYTKQVHTLQYIKNTSLKKEDIFEYFCQLYMEKCYKLKNVWLLKDVPEEVREILSLENRDYGIDLIGVDYNDRYYAIQSKYIKRKSNKKISVTWKQLSTFYELCLKTGPFYKHIVFTTADYVRRFFKKDSKDETIGYNKLKKINNFDWINMSGETKMKSAESSTNKFSIDELRQKRIEFFSN